MVEVSNVLIESLFSVGDEGPELNFFVHHVAPSFGYDLGRALKDFIGLIDLETLADSLDHSSEDGIVLNQHGVTSTIFVICITL